MTEVVRTSTMLPFPAFRNPKTTAVMEKTVVLVYVRETPGNPDRTVCVGVPALSTVVK
jgi:hypothetical protein